MAGGTAGEAEKARLRRSTALKVWGTGTLGSLLQARLGLAPSRPGSKWSLALCGRGHPLVDDGATLLVL